VYWFNCRKVGKIICEDIDWDDGDNKLLVIIDNISTRYHKLPSEVLAKATTFDLLVANTGTMWEIKQREEAEAKASGKPIPPKAPKLSKEQMIAMIKRARSE
jgi:hypothetical protein